VTRLLGLDMADLTLDGVADRIDARPREAPLATSSRRTPTISFA